MMIVEKGSQVYKSHIIPISCSTKLDLPASRVLEKAIDAELNVVLVLGFSEDGDLYAASSTGNEGMLLRLLEKFKHKLMAGDYE
jgi:hypothetical protein